MEVAHGGHQVRESCRRRLEVCTLYMLSFKPTLVLNVLYYKEGEDLLLVATYGYNLSTCNVGLLSRIEQPSAFPATQPVSNCADTVHTLLSRGSEMVGELRIIA